MSTNSESTSVNANTRLILSSLQELEGMWQSLNTNINRKTTAFHEFASSLKSLSLKYQSSEYISSILYNPVSTFLIHEKALSEVLIRTLINFEPTISVHYTTHNNQILHEKAQIIRNVNPVIQKLSTALANYEQERTKYSRLKEEVINTLEDLEVGSSLDPLVGYDVNYTEKQRDKLKSMRKKLEIAQVLYVDAIEITEHRQEEAKISMKETVEILDKLTQRTVKESFVMLTEFCRVFQGFFQKALVEIESLDSGSKTYRESVCFTDGLSNDVPSIGEENKLSAEDFLKKIKTSNQDQNQEPRKDLGDWFRKILDLVERKRTALKVLKIFLQKKKERCEDLARAIHENYQGIIDTSRRIYKDSKGISRLFEDFESMLKVSSERVYTLARGLAIKLLALDNMRAEHNAYHEDFLQIILPAFHEVSQKLEISSSDQASHVTLPYNRVVEIAERVLEALEGYKKLELNKMQGLKTTLDGLSSSYKTFWLGLREDFDKLSEACNCFGGKGAQESVKPTINESIAEFGQDLYRIIEDPDQVYKQANEVPWDKAASIEGFSEYMSSSPRHSTFRASITPETSMSANKISKGAEQERGSFTVKNEQGLGEGSVLKLLKRKGLIELNQEPLDDFSCSVQGKKISKGRLYIFNDKVCFHAGKLQGDLMLVVPQEDIIAVEKRVSSVIFDDGLVIHTRKGELVFTNFMYRDKALKNIQDLLKGDIKLQPQKEAKEERKIGHKRTNSEFTVLTNNMDNKLQYQAKRMYEKSAGLLTSNRRGLYSERINRDKQQEEYDEIRELYRRREEAEKIEFQNRELSPTIVNDNEDSHAQEKQPIYPVGTEPVEYQPRLKLKDIESTKNDGLTERSDIFEGDIQGMSPAVTMKLENSQKALKGIKKLNISNIQNFEGIDNVVINSYTNEPNDCEKLAEDREKNEKIEDIQSRVRNEKIKSD